MTLYQCCYVTPARVLYFWHWHRVIFMQHRHRPFLHGCFITGYQHRYFLCGVNKFSWTLLQQSPKTLPVSSVISDKYGKKKNNRSIIYLISFKFCSWMCREASTVIFRQHLVLLASVVLTTRIYRQRETDWTEETIQCSPNAKLHHIHT